MRKEKVILQNETGLHARPASELAKLAGRFKCDINLSVNEKKDINIISCVELCRKYIKKVK